VADEHAGKLARCPKCQSVYTVPTPGQLSGFATEKLSASGSPGPIDQWRLKTADGMIYGPVPRADMDRWLTEGRVTPDSQLLQEGSEKWQWAGQVYPQLAASGFGPATPGSSLASAYAPAAQPFGNASAGSAFNPGATNPSTGNPFGQANPFSESSVQQSPYSMPAYGGMPQQFNRHYKPHRGVLILVLGILGLSICGLIGFGAAFMGLADLKEINAGRMDPSGKGLTIAGMILGWIAVGIVALSFLFVMFAIIAGN
jgi:hypothetical protein